VEKLEKSRSATFNNNTTSDLEAMLNIIKTATVIAYSLKA